MTVQIHTARMGLDDPDALDVSWLGNMRHGATPGGHRGVGLAFAPLPSIFWPLVKKRRAGTLTDAEWTEYEQLYTEQMRKSWRDKREAWLTVLGWERVVLLCFCTDGRQCHRHILGHLLMAAGGNYRGELERPQPSQLGLELDP